MNGYVCSLCHRWNPYLNHFCAANLVVRNLKTGKTRRLNLLEMKTRG